MAQTLLVDGRRDLVPVFFFVGELAFSWLIVTSAHALVTGKDIPSARGSTEQGAIVHVVFAGVGVPHAFVRIAVASPWHGLHRPAGDDERRQP